MFRYKKGISLSFRPFFSFLYEYFFSCLWFRVLNPPFLPQSKRPSFFFFFGRLKSPHSLYIKANSDVTYHHHHGRRQKKQRVLWLEENDRVRDDGRGVGVVGVRETRHRGRGGVFGNVRRRIGRMGEIGSRAIHGCVVVSFLLLLLLLSVFFACFLARASRVCLAFSSPRARFESIEEQRERLRCIVHRIPIGKKAISMSVSLVSVQRNHREPAKK